MRIISKNLVNGAVNSISIRTGHYRGQTTTRFTLTRPDGESRSFYANTVDKNGLDLDLDHGTELPGELTIQVEKLKSIETGVEVLFCEQKRVTIEPNSKTVAAQLTAEGTPTTARRVRKAKANPVVELAA